MVALECRLLERAVHPLDLAVGPGMIRLGEAMFDAVFQAHPVEHMHAVADRRPCAVLDGIAKLDAIIGEHRVDPVWQGFDKGLEEAGGGLDVGGRMQLKRQTCWSGRGRRTGGACPLRSGLWQCRCGSSQWGSA
jgi:hypothetical protein